MSSTRQGRISSISALTFLALLVVGANLVGYSVANPYTPTGQVPPDQETYPPVITITSPGNNTAYNTSRVLLTFNVTAPYSRTASSVTVQRVTYEVDWQKEAIDVLQGSQKQPSFNLQLSNIPEGQHSITITAVGNGIYVNEEELSYKEFFISSTTAISFTIDYTAPTVSALSLADKTYAFSDVPLYFTVNEPVSQIAYSLDGKENITVSGNTTLNGLSNGDHNVTVYATDETGNTGTSQTITFTISKPEPQSEPFPVAPVAAASIATIAVVGVGLLVYFKKRKH